MSRLTSNVGDILESATAPSSLYVFFVVNTAMAPIVLIAKFHSEISNQLGIPDVTVSMLYGLFFVTGGCVNLLWRREARMRPEIRCAAAGALLALGLAVCSFSSAALYFFISFLILISVLGGAFFLAPIASFAMTRSGSASALMLGIATAGQLTSFGAWSFAIRALAIQEWRSAFQVAAGVVLASTAIGIIALRPARMSVTPTLPVEQGRLRILYLFAIYSLVCLVATALILYLASSTVSQGSLPMYLFSSAALAGRVVVPAVFDTGIRRPSIVFASMVFSLGTLSLFVVPPWLTSILAGFGYGALLPTLMTFTYLRYPKQKDKSSYKMFACGSVGLLAAPFMKELAAMLELPARSFVAWSLPLVILVLYYFAKDGREDQYADHS